MRRLIPALAGLLALAPTVVLSRKGVTTSVTGSSGPTTPIQGVDLTSLAVIAGGITGIAVLAVVVALVLSLLASRPRRTAAPVPVHAPRSPAGFYWWDGSSWRLVPRS
jgi:hypothetical protein